MSLKDEILKLKSSLEERAIELFKAQKISQNQLDSITNECQRLLGLAAKINSIELNQVLTDIDEASQKIINATNSLDQAAAGIQEFQNFFNILSPLIRLGEAISNALSGGGIAAIGNIVTELQDIGDQLNI